MAQNRVPFFKKWKAYLNSLLSRFYKTEEIVTEETDGKDTFYYVRTVSRCTHCGCGVEVETDNKIMTKEEYEEYLRHAPIGKVLKQRFPHESSYFWIFP